MGATSMPSISSLVKQLVATYPDFIFESSSVYAWSPLEKTIYYADNDPAQLLHELAHALLGHRTFDRDLQLIDMERQAWQYAKEKLAAKYRVDIDEDAIENAMDTYRTWLHDRSTCPNCQSTGVQTDPATYQCLACMAKWRVNDARTKELRRLRIK